MPKSLDTVMSFHGVNFKIHTFFSKKKYVMWIKLRKTIFICIKTRGQRCLFSHNKFLKTYFLLKLLEKKNIIGGRHYFEESFITLQMEDCGGRTRARPVRGLLSGSGM